MKNAARWLTDKYICVMLLVFPLWTGFDGYVSVTLSKYLFFAVTTGVWLTGLAVCLALYRPPLARPAAACWAAVAFMASAGLSALCSPYREYTLIGASRYDGFLTLALYGGIFLGVSMFGRPRARYIWLLGGSAALCSAVALFQLRGINPLSLFPDGYDYYDSGVKYTGAFLGTIGNVDVLAAFYALCVPALAALPLLGGGRRCAALLIPAALCLYVLCRSGVASGAVAMAGAALLCAPFICLRRLGPGAARVSAAVSGAVCLAGLGAVYFWPGESGAVWELSRVLHGDIRPAFGSHRVEIWGEALRLAGERPLLGGGPDTLTLRTELGYSRYVEQTGRTLSVHIDNAHNEFLNYLVNIGGLGLCSYLALAGLAVRRWLSGSGELRGALGCGLTGYLIQSFFGLGLCLVAPMVFVFMGLVCADGEEEQ